MDNMEEQKALIYLYGIGGKACRSYRKWIVGHIRQDMRGDIVFAAISWHGGPIELTATPRWEIKYILL